MNLKDKLLESGIPVKLATTLGLVECKETPKDFHSSNVPKGKNTEGILFKYHDLSGKETGYVRYRYLGLKPTSFEKLAGIAPNLKYVQPENTSPALYYPKVVKNWVEISKDAEQEVVITEGELKSIKSSMEMLPTIGIGGVWNWIKDKLPIKDFDDWEWGGRTVYVIFDSDIWFNLNVQSAERQICEELIRRGARPHVTRLCSKEDAVRGKKIGIDDYLVGGGDVAELQFDEYGLSTELNRLNERISLLINPFCIYSKETSVEGKKTMRFKTVEQMRVILAPCVLREVVEKEEPVRWGQRGEKKTVSKVKETKLFDRWLVWKYRSEINNLLYEPGKPELINGDWNTWPGWGCEEVKGDVSLWNSYFDFICTGMSEENKKWFLQWLAYPFRHPGAKLYTAVVLWSARKGVGKSGLGYTLKELYGWENYNKIGDEHLSAKFNDHLVNKQFIMGDEITGGINKRQISDKLKSLITQEEILIEEKYQPKRQIKDTINYLFTSNHPDAFYLEDGDRRYFVHEIRQTPMGDNWYTRYFHWLREGGGKEALLYYFKNEVDLSGFLPTAAAPETDSKAHMTNMGRSDLSTWVRNLRESPDEVLKIGEVVIPHVLATAEDIRGWYDPEMITGTKSIAVGKELSRQMFDKVLGKQIKLNGIPTYIYIIRNSPELRKLLTGEQAVRFYNQERKDFQEVKKERKYHAK